MTFYQDLCNETEQAKTYLLSAPIINDVLQGNFVLSTYAAFLNQAYHHVKHTVPLLMGAGSKLNDSQSWLLKPIAQYIAEEIGHEAWIPMTLSIVDIIVLSLKPQPRPIHQNLWCPIYTTMLIVKIRLGSLAWCWFWKGPVRILRRW